MSAEKRMPPRSFSILQRNSGIVRSCTLFRREHSYLSAADATQEAFCQRWNLIWPHESEDSRVVDSMFPNRAASSLSFVRSKRIKSLCGAKPPQKLRWTNAGRLGCDYGDFTRSGWCGC